MNGGDPVVRRESPFHFVIKEPPNYFFCYTVEPPTVSSKQRCGAKINPSRCNSFNILDTVEE
jgi:hypothetical protein